MSVVVLFLVQFGGTLVRRGYNGLWEPLLFLAVVVCLGAVAVPLLGLAIGGSRDVLAIWRRRRRRLRAAASAEARARAMMSELCPNGWRAQIVVQTDPVDCERRSGSSARPTEGVALEWSELEAGTDRPVVARRVWGATIEEALDAMVADRRTDETLERIEQGAVARGARWPDV